MTGKDKPKPKGKDVEIPEEEEVSTESTWKRETFKGNPPPDVTGKDKDG